MKKFFILILSAVMVFLCAGCAQNTTHIPELDGTLPWFAYRTFVSETSKYNVTTYAMSDEKIAVSENSYLTYTLTTSTENGEILYTLTADCKINFSSSEYLREEYRGKTNTIKSVAVFRRDNLAAVSTHKEANFQSDPASSYSFDVDYLNCSATFTGSDGEVKELSFDKGNYIDNEYVYYYVRAMKNVGASLNETFELVNWYESFASGEFKVFPMVARYYATEGVELTGELLSSFSGSKDEQAKKLNCYAIMISLGGLKTGAPFYAYYSESPSEVVENGTTKSSKKVLTKMTTYDEYTKTGKLLYTTEFVLDEFTPVFSSNDNH